MQVPSQRTDHWHRVHRFIADCFGSVCRLLQCVQRGHASGAAGVLLRHHAYALDHDPEAVFVPVRIKACLSALRRMGPRTKHDVDFLLDAVAGNVDNLDIYKTKDMKRFADTFFGGFAGLTAAVVAVSRAPQTLSDARAVSRKIARYYARRLDAASAGELRRSDMSVVFEALRRMGATHRHSVDALFEQFKFRPWGPAAKAAAPRQGQPVRHAPRVHRFITRIFGSFGRLLHLVQADRADAAQPTHVVADTLLLSHVRALDHHPQHAFASVRASACLAVWRSLGEPTRQDVDLIQDAAENRLVAAPADVYSELDMLRFVVLHFGSFGRLADAVVDDSPARPRAVVLWLVRFAAAQLDCNASGRRSAMALFFEALRRVGSAARACVAMLVEQHALPPDSFKPRFK